MSMVSCQKGPTRHAYAWQIGPFWQDTLDVWNDKGWEVSHFEGNTIVSVASLAVN